MPDTVELVDSILNRFPNIWKHVEAANANRQNCLTLAEAVRNLEPLLLVLKQYPLDGTNFMKVGIQETSIISFCFEIFLCWQLCTIKKRLS